METPVAMILLACFSVLLLLLWLNFFLIVLVYLLVLKFKI